MSMIKLFLILAGAFLGIAGLVLLLAAIIVSFFKIKEADRYYGVDRLGWGRPTLTGLPFSLYRMTEYGLVVFFSNTHLVNK